MKNFKYVYKFLLALPLVFLVGCVGTDDYNDVPSFNNTHDNTVFIETGDASEVTRVAPGGVPVPIVVGINNAPSSDITVSFNVTKDGTTAVEGTDYTLEDATINASEFTGSSDITFLAEGSFVVTVSSASDGSVIAVNNKAIFVVPQAVTFALSWGDDYYDYDIFLFDGIESGYSDFYSNGPPAGSNLLGFSNGVSSYEYFESVPGEGSFYLYIEDFYNDNASIDAVLIVNVYGVDQIFDVVMDMDKWALRIDATIGEDGYPEYTLTQL